MTYTETEIKLYTSDLKAVAAALEATGAQPVKPRLYERNIRYEDAAGSLTGRGIVVRLRQDDRARLTYKEPPPPTSTPADTSLQHRFEAEVEVSDFAAMDVILQKLGYFPAMVYEKYRTTYHLEGTEVVLDEMPYGPFVEIEGEPAAIHQVRERLGLGAAPAFGISYARLFDNVKRNLGLTFTDLTFANFEGIDVPLSAFSG